MIKKNKKYKNKRGDKVKIYSTNGWGSMKIHGAYKDDLGWHICSWTVDGSSTSTNEFRFKENNSLDLVIKKEKK